MWRACGELRFLLEAIRLDLMVYLFLVYLVMKIEVGRTKLFWLWCGGHDVKAKVCTSLVWYSIDREDQENESIFLYKRRIARLDQNYKEWYQTKLK